jgi:hypothetical protein
MMLTLRMPLVVGLVLTACALVAPAAHAALIRVPTDVPTLQGAIQQVANGDVIEIAAGTYASPAGGFTISSQPKAFTIRAASGATVVLDGGNTRDVLRLINSSVAAGRPVTFEGLTFANGRSTSDGIAGGVTLHQAQATFVQCVFQNNRGDQTSTGGGGTLVGLGSTAFFTDCQWIGNSAKNSGGGLAITGQSKAYVHASQFTGNRTNLPGHSPIAMAGGIYVGDATLRVSNTRFVGNQAGYVGGALYAIGTWTSPVSTPQSDVVVSNCTFVDNVAARDPSVAFSGPPEGGAFHAEDQTRARIYNSRFTTNRATIGGGVNLYRAIVEVYRSVFEGNQAGAFGGAFSATSNDVNDPSTNFGAINRRPAQLTVRDTLVRGRFGAVTTVAPIAGGLYAAGDGNRLYGLNGATQMGTAAENRASVTVQNVVFADCDVQQAADVPGSGQGGALYTDLGALTMQDSVVINSDAPIAGGGLMLINQSAASITGTTVAHNTAGSFGAGIFLQGSSIAFDNGRIVHNEISPGVSEAVGASLGAAIFAAPDGGSLPATGSVSNSIISSNIGLPIYDDDRTNGPINDVRYNGNQIWSTTFGASVYNNPLSGTKTVAQLNSLVVNRANGTSTAKSQVANTALAFAPVVGAILAVPPAMLPVDAAGDPAPPTASYLGYAWSGGTATLDGNAVSGNAGLSPAAGTGTHVLAVGGTQFSVPVDLAATPDASLSAAPNPITPGSTSTLSWSTPAGAFLDGAIDQGVAIPSAASGSIGVTPPVSMTYRFFDVLQEGGATAAVTVVSGTPPPLGVPTVTNPSPGQVIGVEGVTFAWTAVSGATAYDLRILNAATQAVIFTGSLSGGESTTTLIGVPNNGSYTFQVRACAGTVGDASCGGFANRAFSVSLVAPSAAPSITSPAPGANFTASQQVLQWTAVAGSPLLPDLYYEVRLTNRTTGLTELQFRTIHPTVQAAVVLRSALYRMQVRACQAGCGPYSAAVDFAVALGAVPTAKPTITSAVVSGGNSLAVSWTAVTGAEWYQVQVVQPRPAGPGGGALTVAARQVSGATSTTLAVPAGQASVIVAACNADGCGPYSTAASINPTGPNPSAPQIGSPLDGSVVTGPSTLFTWTRIPGDTGNTVYRLYVQDLSRQRAALDVYTSQNFYGALLNAEGGKYAAVVIANPGPGQVGGPPINFTVRGSSAVAPTLMAPTLGSVLPAGNVLLGWTPVPGATLYEYLVSVQGAAVASGRGVTPGIFVQVPLTAVNGQATVYNGIVRACPAGQTCSGGSDAGWGPWSSAAGSGVISFTVTP